MQNEFLTVLMLSLAVSSVSVTLTKSGIFRNLRFYVASHSNLLGQLFRCNYCMSHWLSFCAVISYSPRVTHGFILFDYAVSSFIMVTLAAVIMGVMLLLIPFTPDILEEDDNE